MMRYFSLFVFFNDTATTEIYTLSLHDALPISSGGAYAGEVSPDGRWLAFARRIPDGTITYKGHEYGPRTALWLRDLERSEEHTSELQSRQYLVCRLLLEKKKKTITQMCVHITE